MLFHQASGADQDLATFHPGHHALATYRLELLQFAQSDLGRHRPFHHGAPQGVLAALLGRRGGL